ncbi:hypothetical protein [Microvirga sp. VF16]|uniref:DUF6894 family protein n=1 Tax=Microvirga sp. VF16 TaxID=2807101 RepID=UPI0035303959
MCLTITVHRRGIGALVSQSAGTPTGLRSRRGGRPEPCRLPQGVDAVGFRQPLARIYFHLVKGDQVIPDATGVLVPDFETALPRVLESIQEMQERAYPEDWQGWQLKVVDASGDVLLSLRLDTYFSRSPGRVS